ncbi:MAG: NUDIX hydrolase [Bacteroidetes bacterium]|nr:NUDIX hydrolase [Bacteroidota bacterium]
MTAQRPFAILEREKKYSGKIIDLTVDHIRYPSGTTGIREVVEHPGGAVIICLFGNDDILLVRQYRHPFGEEVTELPAGKLDAGEDPLVCAQRELREETGYGARQWEKLTALYATPGFCDEVLHLFLARDPFPEASGQALEEGESSLRVHRVPLRDAIAMIERREIVDGKTIAGILLADRKRQNL